MFRSLRWRIQIWHAVILGVVIFVFATMMYVQQRHSRFRAIDSELSAAVEVIVGKLEAASPTALESFLNESPEANDSDVLPLSVPNTFAPRRHRHQFEVPYFVVWSSNGTEVSRSSGVEVTGLIETPSEAESVQLPFRNRGKYREAYAVGPMGAFVLVGRFIEPDRRDLRELLLILSVIGSSVFLMGLAGGWFLSRKSVHPIEQISSVASEISERNLSDRIDVSKMDLEFGQLSNTLNGTFARLETAFAQQAQFTADASHELRTPLAVIKMHQELALSKDRTTDEYKDALRTCQRATKRMGQLVDSLLTLARMDADGLKLQFERVNVQEVIAAAIEEAVPLAEAKQIAIDNRSESAFVNGDVSRLNQVLINLIANAITYCPPASSIVVSNSVADGRVIIDVADDGPGIAKSDLPKVFDRFYRVEKERSRETSDSSGSGLGLSICKTIVEAHKGTISVESSKTGSTFRVRLVEMVDGESNSD